MPYFNYASSPKLEENNKVAIRQNDPLSSSVMRFVKFN